MVSLGNRIEDWLLLFEYKGRRVCPKIHSRALPILLGINNFSECKYKNVRFSFSPTLQPQLRWPQEPPPLPQGPQGLSQDSIRAAVRKLGMKPKGRVVLKGGDVPTPAEAAAPAAAAPRVAAAATPASPVYAVSLASKSSPISETKANSFSLKP
jgi:hypothetical protein